MTSIPPHLSHPKYRPDIDGLRGIAVLSVVAFHAFPNWVKGGFTGVDVFFVISGFLISTIIFDNLDKETFSFTEFYARRIKRIFPSLFLVLMASYVFGWFALLPDEYEQLGKHIAGGAGFVSNFLFWNEAGYFDNAAGTKPLLHLWSLGIEEQFYIVWPLLLWLAWKRQFNLLYVTILVAGVSFYLNVKGIKDDASATFYSPQTRFWELLCGSLLAWVTINRKGAYAGVKDKLDRVADDKTRANVISGFGLFLLAYGFWQIDKKFSFPGLWAVVPVLGAVLIITAGQKAFVNRTILSNPLVVWFGLISFPLYLWHWPLLSFARIVLAEAPSRNIRIAVVVLSVALAWATYKFVERPIRLGGHSTPKVITLALLMTFIGYLGYNAFYRHGLSFRVNQEQFRWDDRFYRESQCLNEIGTSKDRLPNTFCLGNITTADILLLGDSHSNALARGLMELLPNRIVNLAGGGCIPFYNVDSGLKGLSPQCPSDDSNFFLKIAETRKNISTLIISFRGPLYLEGSGFGEVEKDHKRYIKSSDTADIGHYADVYEKSMRATFERLVALKKHIVFVLDVPELGFEPKICVDNLPLRLLVGRVKKVCAVAQKDFEDRNIAYRSLVKHVLKDFPSVKVFDASEIFCDGEWCWALQDGEMLYRDNNHLSLQGSRLVAKKLSVLIDQKSSP